MSRVLLEFPTVKPRGYKMITMDTDFVEWLEHELQERGWGQSELAHKGDIPQSTLSRIMLRDRQLGPEIGVRIARALKLPPEEIFRAAGLLPALPASGEEKIIYEIIDIARRLSPGVREDLREYALWRYKREYGDRDP